MVNYFYFYKWTPLAIVVTVAILSLPWLGLIALTVISLVALAALALAFVFVPYLLIRAISLRLHERVVPPAARADETR
jgi:hypothetical protein